MSDPFSIAADQIFASIAKEAVLRNDQGDFPILLVENHQLFLDGQNFNAPIVDNRIVFDVLKKRLINVGDTILYNAETFIVDGILTDDGYSIKISVVR